MRTIGDGLLMSLRATTAVKPDLSGITMDFEGFAGVKLIFECPDDLDQFRSKYVYIVSSGELAQPGCIETVKYRLAPAKRAAHQVMGRKHGKYNWVEPDKKNMEFGRWEAGGDWISVRRHRVG